jgi:hypothetical protein
MDPRIRIRIHTKMSWIRNTDFCGAGKWRSRGGLRLEHESVTLACAAALVKKKIYRDLVDFDNHLDDITQVPFDLAAGYLNMTNFNNFYIFFIRILIDPH